jgi:hypothetical protein
MILRKSYAEEVYVHDYGVYKFKKIDDWKKIYND